jgi:hypothetical protein
MPRTTIGNRWRPESDLSTYCEGDCAAHDFAGSGSSRCIGIVAHLEVIFGRELLPCEEDMFCEIPTPSANHSLQAGQVRISRLIGK